MTGNDGRYALLAEQFAEAVTSPAIAAHRIAQHDMGNRWRSLELRFRTIQIAGDNFTREDQRRAFAFEGHRVGSCREQ